MSDTKVSAMTAASDLVSAVLVGETSGVNKSYPIALFDTRYQASSANLTSWAAITRASGFDTFVATPNSSNFASLITDETGTGKVVLGTSPTILTSLTVNNNAASLPSVVAGTVVQIGGADATQARLLFDGFGAGGNPNFTFRASLGTATSRSALTTNTVIGSIAAFGAYDSTNYSATGRATITFNAAENWSSTNQGSLIQFFTTPNTTTTQGVVGTWGNDGLLSISGGSLGRGAPVTKTADFTVATTENWLINNKAAATCTVTLPAASTVTGREITIKTIQAFTVVSASSNVVPLAGGAAATAILAATTGKWATLVSDGTNWVIMAGN